MTRLFTLYLLILNICYLQAADWHLMSDQAVVKKLKEDGKVIFLESGKIYLEKGSLTSAEEKKLGREFQEAIHQITSLLGNDINTQRYKNRVPSLFVFKCDETIPHVYFGYNSNYSEYPYILMPSPIVKAGYAPLLHELTHIIEDTFWSLSLREGLADFIQFYLRPGQRATMKKTVTDFHSHAREILKKDSNVYKYIGGGGHEFLSDRDRVEFYQLSRSFVAFLIYTYGGSKFLDLYRGRKKYEDLYGKSLESLKKEWPSSIQKPLTAKDFQQNPFRQPWYYFYWQKLMSVFI